MNSGDQLAQNWLIVNVFSFGFTGFALVLFPLYLFWINIFLEKLELINLNGAIQLLSSRLWGRRRPLKCKRMQAGKDGGHFSVNVQM